MSHQLHWPTPARNVLWSWGRVTLLFRCVCVSVDWGSGVVFAGNSRDVYVSRGIQRLDLEGFDVDEGSMSRGICVCQNMICVGSCGHVHMSKGIFYVSGYIQGVFEDFSCSPDMFGAILFFLKKGVGSSGHVQNVMGYLKCVSAGFSYSCGVSGGIFVCHGVVCIVRASCFDMPSFCVMGCVTCK